jgi:hypothetical protein
MTKIVMVPRAMPRAFVVRPVGAVFVWNRPMNTQPEALTDAARAAAPKARPNPSPGQRPGNLRPMQKSQALKGRPNSSPHLQRTRFGHVGSPFQGWCCLFVSWFPGRCPGLSWTAPSGLMFTDRHGSQGDALGFHGPPRWGLCSSIVMVPRAMPWAFMARPVGAYVRLEPPDEYATRSAH